MHTADRAFIAHTTARMLLEVKKKEIDAINARYDEDKKRFAALTGKK